ncbi:hypothetical protein XFPR_12400 [Xylella fastidiosa]|nr:hypothetical protein [Xylella fastidiosa]QPB73056.1 hypothetical protein XFPR_12400 [Xylella fastidiosa]
MSAARNAFICSCSGERDFFGLIPPSGGFSRGGASTCKRLATKAIKLIKFLEGLRLQAYLCEAGVLTIGYGETAPHVGPLNSRKGGSVAIKTLETIPVLVAAVVREIAQPRDCPACHGRGRVCVGMLMR